MRLVDTQPWHDWKFFEDVPNDEPPLTEDERRQERENERDARLIQRLFE